MTESLEETAEAYPSLEVDPAGLAARQSGREPVLVDKVEVSMDSVGERDDISLRNFVSRT